MAVGVPENDVFAVAVAVAVAVADPVLGRGERPTVERVRLHLGRGSPARVGGLLDQWWARLAERLNGATRLPTLSTEVAEAFVAVWQQSTYLAQGVAEQALTEQRQVMIAEHEQWPPQRRWRGRTQCWRGNLRRPRRPPSKLARLA
jgi:hypothetical protein